METIPTQNKRKSDFTPTAEMIHAAELYFVAEAHRQLITEKVLDYQRRILQEGQWPISAEFQESLPQHNIILDPKSSFLMSDEHFKMYDERCQEERIKHGLVVTRPGNCPKLEAESTVREASYALLTACKELPPMLGDVDSVYQNLDIAKKTVELLLRLLAPHVSNAPAILSGMMMTGGSKA